MRQKVDARGLEIRRKMRGVRSKKAGCLSVAQIRRLMSQRQIPQQTYFKDLQLDAEFVSAEGG